jgi:hypothetical protein
MLLLIMPSVTHALMLPCARWARCALAPAPCALPCRALRPLALSSCLPFALSPAAGRRPRTFRPKEIYISQIAHAP